MIFKIDVEFNLGVLRGLIVFIEIGLFVMFWGIEIKFVFGLLDLVRW